MPRGIESRLLFILLIQCVSNAGIYCYYLNHDPAQWRHIICDCIMQRVPTQLSIL